MNQFCLATMIARTTLGTHNPRISAQTVTHRLREIGERPPYTMYVLYAAFLFWPSIYGEPEFEFWCTGYASQMTSTNCIRKLYNNYDFSSPLRLFYIGKQCG